MAPNNNRDRISNLPDSLLCHVLSFLPTKDSVASSILSTRWKPLWTLVPNIYLDYDNFKRISSSDQLNNQYHFNFGHMLFRFWALRTENRVQKFKHSLRWLYRSPWDPIHVDSCLCAAIARGVEQLSLEIILEQRLVLPRSLFSCTTLVVLILGLDILIDPPPASSTIALLSLKTLHLEHVKYANEEAFGRLLSGCLIIQNFFLTAFGLKSTYKFKIIVQTLKELHLWINYDGFLLKINAQDLEYLHFRGTLYSDILLENSFNLVETVIDIDDYGEWAWDFIRKLYNVKSLHFSTGIVNIRHFFFGLFFKLLYPFSLTSSNIMFFFQCLFPSSNYDSMKFHDLALMNLSVSYCNKHDMLGLLECAPNLEELVLEQPCPTLFSDEQRNVRWPLDVPKCLSSCLTTFHFEVFRWSKDELELIRYLLKSSRFLKKMTITSKPPDSEEKFNLLKELLMFPRHSRTCKIAFVYD